MPVLDLIESLQLHPGAALAFAVALGLAALARLLRRPLPAGIAAGAGLLAGWWLTFGLLTASPRQLPERLPPLALMLLLATVLLLPLSRRWPRFGLPATLLGALLAGWWMAGAPLVRADMARGAAELAAVAAATVLLARASGPSWAGFAAAAALLGALLLAPMPGPQAVLAAVLVAATLGALAVPPRPGGSASLSALPVAGPIMALAALPVIARGAPADWAVAAAPVLTAALGIPLGARLGGRGGAVLGALLAAAGCGIFAFLIR
jgi:hypothetical protein